MIVARARNGAGSTKWVSVSAVVARNLEREVQVRRRREHRGRAERADVLAADDVIAGLQAVGDVVDVHVRGERAVVVLDADVAAADPVEAELLALDADDDAVGHRDDRPAARAVEVDAAVALAALGARHEIAMRGSPNWRGCSVGTSSVLAVTGCIQARSDGYSSSSGLAADGRQRQPRLERGLDADRRRGPLLVRDDRGVHADRLGLVVVHRREHGRGRRRDLGPAPLGHAERRERRHEDRAGDPRRRAARGGTITGYAATGTRGISRASQQWRCHSTTAPPAATTARPPCSATTPPQRGQSSDHHARDR